MNLNDIMQAAQGGQGVTNLANQFGLSPDQAQAAISAMMPAFSQGLQGAMTNPGALGSILSQMASGAHAPSYTGAAPAGPAPTGDILGSIFGNPQVMGQLSQQAAQMSGISPQTLQQMMPAVASILMGGLAHNMNTQGMGGILGQLASAATGPGGLGAAMGGAAPGSGGGLFGAIMGMFTGGAQNAQTGQSGAMQTGLSTLTNMLNAGVQVSQAHQQGLNSILQSIASATQPRQ
jgi:hypothetical protein